MANSTSAEILFPRAHMLSQPPWHVSKCPLMCFLTDFAHVIKRRACQVSVLQVRLFVCLFVCAYDSRYACGGTATAETTFLGRDPEYTRVTAEETRCRIATSPLSQITLVMADLVTVFWEKCPLSPHLSAGYGLPGHFRDHAQCRSCGLSSASVTSVGVLGAGGLITALNYVSIQPGSVALDK